MHINANFVDKQTSSIHIIALVATTQEEFNEQMQSAYETVVGMGWSSFTIETETSDGDEALLARWADEFEPLAGTFEEISDEQEPLRNDHLQFARLLAGLQKTGALTPAVLGTLSSELGCEASFILDVAERATCAFGDYLERGGAAE
jgi:hypothetical protein